MEALKELFENLSKASNRETCFRHYMGYVEQFGLNGGMLISTPIYTEDLGDYFNYISTYNVNFFNDYLSAGGIKNDIFAKVLMSRKLNQISYPIEAEVDQIPIYLGREIKREELMIEEISRDYGINNGFAVALDYKGGFIQSGIGICAVGVSDKEYLENIIPNEQFMLQANALLKISLKRFDFEIESKRISLTSRQYDVLNWVASGLRLKEIADTKVYRSIHTINKELQTLKLLLNARTNEELIAKGFLLGLIE